MVSTTYCYEADWRPYAFAEDASCYVTEAELEASFTRLDLHSSKPLPAGGMPILSDRETVIANTDCQMSILFGSTGSGKTRKLIAPLLCLLAKAQESMIVMDIKGELSNGSSFPQVQASLEENNYECIYLDFRSKDGDGYSILEEPYRLYRSGQKDEATRMVNDLADALASIYHGTKSDPFWEMTSKQYFVACTLLLFELCDNPEMINMLSLASYTNEESCDNMKKVAELIERDNNIMTMLRNVVSEPEKTRMSTLATVNSFFSGFVTDGKLLGMLSHSTFDIHNIYRKPTALFLIVPDEVDTYDGIVGLLLNQFKAVLVSDAYRLGAQLPRRVNFVCDEFCNYYVPGMRQAISAHRSRNIRWYIVCQGMQQLKSCYPDEADTILANCTNLFFLNSPDLDLMEYLSRRAGTTRVSESGAEVPLISVADLQSLQRGWDSTEVYFTYGNRHYVGQLPDITRYAIPQSSHHPYCRPRRTFPLPKIYSAEKMKDDVVMMRVADEQRKNKGVNNSLEKKLSDRYRALFCQNNPNHT